MTVPQAGKPSPEFTRPRFPDYVLMLVGVALSVFLADFSGLHARPSQLTYSTLVGALARVFPALLFLSLGVVLFWPIFYLNQKILGRRQELTWAEWLWGLAWIGSLILAVWIAVRGLGSSAEAVPTGVVLAYVLFDLSLGALAAVLFIVGLLGRWAVPWTHTFGLALLTWPLLPLAAWWLLGLKLE
jgi:hypothetical protein